MTAGLCFGGGTFVDPAGRDVFEELSDDGKRTANYYQVCFYDAGWRLGLVVLLMGF